MKRVRGDLASPGSAVRTVYISDTYDDDLVQRLVDALPDLSPNAEGTYMSCINSFSLFFTVLW